MSDLATEIIAREEGFRPYAYQDSLGYWTIGYGLMIDKRRGGGITRPEAEFLLRGRIDAIEAQIIDHLPWVSSLDEVRRAILISMAYQMGVWGLLGFQTTLRYIYDGLYTEAAGAMRLSKWYAQTPERAERMAKAMEVGHFA